MDLLDKISNFWKKWDDQIGAIICTVIWSVIFLVFLYGALMTDTIFKDPAPLWLGYLIVFMAYLLPLSALAAIICIWYCYYHKKSLMYYCNLIPFVTIVILIPIFLLFFSIIQFLL